MRPQRWGLLLVALLLFSGCSGGSTPTPPLGTRVVPPGSSDQVVIAMADLARRLGISATQVSLAGVEAVDWPDTSLGCPQPGMAYAQVITPGYRILLSATGQTYEYHSDRSSQVVLCTPAPPQP
ncbi:MAG: hypothetical protein HYX99_01770 [Chloroflexi bacterium]|nr:hypothetical protein [Chloroflexota bacterium]